MLSSPFAATVNHLLAQEPWAAEKLARHAGKVACFDGGVTQVRVKVARDGMLQPAAADETPNVTIRARLADLPLIAQNRERAFSYVQIEGDADFANTISQLSQSLRWEAEADLSRLVGDIAATRLVGGARALADAARATHRTVTANLAEYFLEENPTLVRPRAVADFATEVARLRDDVERLEKRIAKLNGSR
ncbi:sterol-binding protein [Oxalobacteraceae bacterium OM1]|nr:sterol-binding protein [Oxalobacteraceae bacterium OM1]